MHNSAPVLENYTHKLLWDFDIHTDHLISARRPDLIIMNKKKNKKKQKKNKLLYEHLRRKIEEIVDDMSWTWLRKGNLMGETKSLLIAAENNPIKE